MGPEGRLSLGDKRKEWREEKGMTPPYSLLHCRASVSKNSRRA